jgi:hypothetical protein
LLYKHLTKEFIRVRIGHASTAGFLDPGELRPSHASGLLTFGIPKNASAVSEWFIRTPRRRRNHQISSTFSCFGSDDPQRMANFYITESIINFL